MPHRPSVLPPTVLHLKAMGVLGARLDCIACARRRELKWDEIGVSDATPFPEIKIHRSFVCSRCGSREFTLMPDWSGYRPQGGGG